MSNIKLKILNQYSVFAPFTKKSLKDVMSYYERFNDSFDSDSMDKMKGSEVMAAGIAGAISYAITGSVVSATFNKSTKMILHKYKASDGVKLFVVRLTKSKSSSDWMMVTHVDVVDTPAPRSMARTLNKCNLGKKVCISSSPSRKGLYNTYLYIIAENS